MSTYLTKLVPNLRSQEARRDLGNVQRMHQRVMSLFPSDAGPTPRNSLGVLYRVDEQGNTPSILVQSSVRPETGQLGNDYDCRGTADIGPLLDWLGQATEINYKILVNPVRRMASGPAKGKLVGLSEQEAFNWWASHGSQAGLGALVVATLRRVDLAGRSHGQSVLLRAWEITGTASVADAGGLRQAIVNGLGKGRAYGCGMLSVAPARK